MTWGYSSFWRGNISNGGIHIEQTYRWTAGEAGNVLQKTQWPVVVEDDGWDPDEKQYIAKIVIPEPPPDRVGGITKLKIRRRTPGQPWIDMDIPPPVRWPLVVEVPVRSIPDPPTTPPASENVEVEVELEDEEGDTIAVTPTFTVTVQPPKLPPPEKVRVVAGNKLANVTWEEPDVPPGLDWRGYDWRYGEDGETPGSITRTDNRYVDLTRLQNGQKYEVQVRTHSNDLRSCRHSDWVTVGFTPRRRPPGDTAAHEFTVCIDAW